VFCSRCGHQLDDAARFCPSCGLDLATATPVKSPAAAPSAEHTETDVIREALATEYEIIEELGRGGMAIVFRARERQLDREVALKVLPFSLAFDAEFVERFQREARTAARLEHPSIIPIYRVGRSGRVTYFVMKLLRGQSLSEQLAHRGRLPPAEIRSLLIQAAGALGYAHKHGIVHRDVKPDNIMFDELGHAVLTDFGIAKAASGTRLTGTGMSIGTPHYMSPEQARAQPLDGRSDLYSLGVVAYQCLAGQVPFDGEDAFSIGYKHIMEALPVPALDTVDQRRVFAVIRRMMAKAPEDRYQTAEVLVRDLEARPSVALPGEEFETAPTLTLGPHEAAQALGIGRAGAASRVGMPATPTTPVPRAEFPTRRRPAWPSCWAGVAWAATTSTGRSTRLSPSHPASRSRARSPPRRGWTRRWPATRPCGRTRWRGPRRRGWRRCPTPVGWWCAAPRGARASSSATSRTRTASWRSASTRTGCGCRQPGSASSRTWC
jgi:hypothetical protein